MSNQMIINIPPQGMGIFIQNKNGVVEVGYYQLPAEQVPSEAPASNVATDVAVEAPLPTTCVVVSTTVADATSTEELNSKENMLEQLKALIELSMKLWDLQKGLHEEHQELLHQTKKFNQQSNEYRDAKKQMYAVWNKLLEIHKDALVINENLLDKIKRIKEIDTSFNVNEFIQNNVSEVNMNNVPNGYEKLVLDAIQIYRETIERDKQLSERGAKIAAENARKKEQRLLSQHVLPVLEKVPVSTTTTTSRPVKSEAPKVEKPITINPPKEKPNYAKAVGKPSYAQKVKGTNNKTVPKIVGTEATLKHLKELSETDESWGDKMLGNN